MTSIPASPAASVDEPFYYLCNFHFVLDWVEARYADLLSDEERERMAAFRILPRPSRALLVRMLMRKGAWLRESRLAYAEIGDTRGALAPLAAAGFVDARPALTLAQLFELLTKAEIVAAFPGHGLSPSLRKQALYERLAPDFDALCQGFDAWYPASDERILAVTCEALGERLRLMFFGNLRQDWSTFVLADLGVFRYERVAFTQNSRAFQRRDEIDAYLHLHHCRERFEAGEAPETIIAALPGAYDNDWLEARRARLLLRLGRHCERNAQPRQALALYADCTRPEARLRRLRILEHEARFDDALALARQAQASPHNETEVQHLTRLLPRLHRKLGLPAAPRATEATVERLELTLQPGLRVEEAVRAHLETPGAPVHYVENALINSLFGLLCWEAIFAPLPGAFFHPFHDGPADLLRADFHDRRHALFAACLARLDGDAYRATIRANYVAKQGLRSPFVHWGLLDETLLELALHCLPAAHLKGWFQRLLDDVKANRAGLPDLIQFWPQGDGAGRRYRMIEVKGPGDRLQDNQRRWLAFCAAREMPVAVCHVRWTESVMP